MLYVPEHEIGFILAYSYLKARVIWKSLTRVVIGNFSSRMSYWAPATV